MISKNIPVAKRPLRPRWYLDQQLNYADELKTKGKVAAYFVVETGRYGRAIRGDGPRRAIVKYLKVFENGMAVSVDVTMMKVSVTQSIGQPFKLKPSTRGQFNKALRDFMKLIG